MDTSVLVAGIAGFKSPEITPKNPSAKLFRDWIERDTFVWLITDEIISENKRIMARLFGACAEQGKADFIVTLNPKDFPQSLLSAHVIRPGERVPTTARRRQPRRS